ncbi:PEP/pyruvate-binding domain-containing protein [Hyalangium rubrum]|uniref:Phosphoenolpyruvate synthase n=1 Tax=Hyalangium rubrum TaxID=3103134 RepID=A0ABU5GYI9_9BACT|nr:PEP/pyruvate-binding domain-containing protein [Hyalangium sp. s54d21]MDY7226266.1 PEP/pyruvate-binding domain-containing protein [Hyalangium sp. s54d21]
MQHFARALSSAWLLVLFVALFQAEAAPRRHAPYVSEIRDAATFSAYALPVETDDVGKFLIDLKSGGIYYFDVNLYRLHQDFVIQVLFRRPMTDEERTEYFRNYREDKPHYILGYVTHHRAAKRWTFSFWESDRIRPADVRRARDTLLKTFFVQDIAFRPESTRQEELLAELKDIPTVTSDTLYKQADYRPFNTGAATGRLRVVPPGTPYESLLFDSEDIVILQESYPDLPPVAGVLSTQFSTPLSHVNLRARAWGIPNATLKDAATRYAALDGQVVRLDVRGNTHVLRPATEKELATWKQAREAARTVLVPAADLTAHELRPLKRMRARDTRLYGTKAANLGEIIHAKLPGVHVPDGFGIPFAFYVEHLQRHGLHTELEAMLAEPRFQQEAAFRKERLEKFRARIAGAPLDEAFLNQVETQVREQLGGKGVFVRSSTNAEDLKGFNGAGLYDTVPNVVGREALSAAIRQVWASLWNFHAVEERKRFGIEPRSVFSAVLVQVGINATAAGVLVTKNLYDPRDKHTFTINAKRGLGLSVVSGVTVPEQVLYDIRYPGARVLSRSDDATMLVFDAQGGIKEVPTGSAAPVLAEARARDLSLAAAKLRKVFPDSGPLDIEWVLEGEKVWIVQSRPFIDGAR